ncbi:aldo/keto reductase [Massilia endophytica]|uniref:aldo/keto reductase n=1 Tax=Massilia endophytica TaxID=2899220 RepID=UPI001E4FB934|nr:aldo/keto reductase [Massilia endophytica]UGQ46665.1 aldo/keto reductase [Massilia endophytica]
MSQTPCPALRTSDDGLELSRIVAGMWRMKEWEMTPQQRLALIEQCLDMGVSSFDHADIYGGYQVESLFGEALALRPALRERMQIVSKCGIKLVGPARPSHGIKHYDTTAAHIAASVDNSLKALRTDHLDLLLIHRPDPLMDFDEMADAFKALRAAGKVKHFGVSNFSRHQFECLHRRIPLATNQVEFSPLHLAPMFDETFDGLQDKGVAPMIWSPLAGGRLFDKENAKLQPLRGKIQQIANELNRPFSSVVFAWMMALPSRPIPLTGSGRIAAIAEAVEATRFTLEREQWFDILGAARQSEVA